MEELKKKSRIFESIMYFINLSGISKVDSLSVSRVPMKTTQLKEMSKVNIYKINKLRFCRSRPSDSTETMINKYEYSRKKGGESKKQVEKNYTKLSTSRYPPLIFL